MKLISSGRIAALVAVAVILAVVIVGWALLISPQRSKASDLSVQIDNARVQIAATKAYVSSPVAKRSVRDLRRLRRILPDQAEAARILRQLTAAAHTAQVSINTVTPQSVVPAGGAQALPITLTIDGHYFGISTFLHLLRTQVAVHDANVRGKGRLYTVDSVQFLTGSSGTVGTGAQGSASGNTITATIALNAFIFGSAVPGAPSTETTPGATTTS